MPIIATCHARDNIASPVGQIVNLRRIVNPPRDAAASVSVVAALPAHSGRRVANPPQDTMLPHKTPAFIPSPFAAAVHPKQVTNLPRLLAG
jgi:hypothetical protein